MQEGSSNPVYGVSVLAGLGRSLRLNMYQRRGLNARSKKKKKKATLKQRPKPFCDACFLFIYFLLWEKWSVPGTLGFRNLYGG